MLNIYIPLKTNEAPKNSYELKDDLKQVINVGRIHNTYSIITVSLEETRREEALISQNHLLQWMIKVTEEIELWWELDETYTRKITERENKGSFLHIIVCPDLFLLVRVYSI